MKFTINVNQFIQLVLLAIQTINAYPDIIPEKHKVQVAALIGALQFFISRIAQTKNADGTPQTEPYVRGLERVVDKAVDRELDKVVDKAADKAVEKIVNDK